ncbi:AaceriAER022Wp [[Ashbya] aceris (nom. inval.)]|nr:AaceriAER022Wp [[Ashbya] aceris (nom. inval.)]
MKVSRLGFSSLALAGCASAMIMQHPFSALMSGAGDFDTSEWVDGLESWSGLGQDSKLGKWYAQEMSGPRNMVQKTAPGRSGFEVMTHADSDYALRVKEQDPAKLGVDTVKQWSGYLDYKDEKHFFYWFFESRNDPANDPVLLWLNGGPGCSSFTGLFFELGPASIGKDLKPVRNPHSWNNNASVIFLEQPVGVGFSYGDNVDSTAVAGADVYEFLRLFFQKFPHLAKNDFHIAGESYAGHYIPQIAHEIITRKEEEPEELPNFNLTSVLIGNGFTDPRTQYKYYEPMACGEGGFPAVLNEDQCGRMNSSSSRCDRLMSLCYLTNRAIPCLAATVYCERYIAQVYSETGLNYYDMRGPCENPQSDLCYDGLDYVQQYMNQKEVQEALGSEVEVYEGCSRQVGARFALSGDSGKPFQQYVSQLLDRAIPVLIYAGDKDYICNWLGNKAWSDEVGWRHTYKYRTLPLKPWINKNSGKAAGEVKSFGALTFLRVYDAGHMVPYDQPENSSYMIESWLNKNYNLDYKI